MRVANLVGITPGKTFGFQFQHMRNIARAINAEGNCVVAGPPWTNFTVSIHSRIFAGLQIFIYLIKMLEFSIVRTEKVSRDVPSFFTKRSKMLDR